MQKDRGKPFDREQAAHFTYLKQLQKKYHGFLVLDEGTEFLGYDTAVDHRCLLCGETVPTRPTTLLNLTRIKDDRTKSVTYKQNKGIARGCLVCRSTEQHAQELAEFRRDLKAAHDGKFSLAFLPQRFERDSGKYKQTFVCRDCGSQHYQTPMTILDKKFKCGTCVRQSQRGEQSSFYVERLNKLYGENRIRMVGRYHDTNEIIHECSEGHIWTARSQTLLEGCGCPTCKNSVSVKRVAPYEHHNRTYLLRTKREVKALPLMIAKLNGKHRNLKTSRDFPTPILFGKNAVAFFDTKTRIVVDVMTEKTLKANVRRKIPRSLVRAKKLGLHYGVILITAKEVVGLWDRKTLLREKAKKKSKIEVPVQAPVSIIEGDADWDDSPFSE